MVGSGSGCVCRSEGGSGGGVTGSARCVWAGGCVGDVVGGGVGRCSPGD